MKHTHAVIQILSGSTFMVGVELMLSGSMHALLAQASSGQGSTVLHSAAGEATLQAGSRVLTTHGTLGSYLMLGMLLMLIGLSVHTLAILHQRKLHRAHTRKKR